MSIYDMPITSEQATSPTVAPQRGDAHRATNYDYLCHAHTRKRDQIAAACDAAGLVPGEAVTMDPVLQIAQPKPENSGDPFTSGTPERQRAAREIMDLMEDGKTRGMSEVARSLDDNYSGGLIFGPIKAAIAVLVREKFLDSDQTQFGKIYRKPGLGGPIEADASFKRATGRQRRCLQVLSCGEVMGAARVAALIDDDCQVGGVVSSLHWIAEKGFAEKSGTTRHRKYKITDAGRKELGQCTSAKHNAS